MNQRQLGRLLKRIVLLTVPLPVAVAGAACGGSASMDGTAAGGAAGSKSTGGDAGTLASGGSGGSSAGSVGVGGSSAGGSSAGSVGVGGSSSGGSSEGGGAGTKSCTSTTPTFCGPSQVIVDRSCIDPGMAVVGPLPSTTCSQICGLHAALTCSITAVDAASVTVDCVTGCVTGRRPAGLRMPLLLEASGVGAYFADLARLEAASVDAFRILHGELRAHGAPKKLVRAAARAARDEVRHTRSTSALARRFGTRPRHIEVDRGAPRSIEVMAIENAVEGCVRETYGALLATWQAHAASDPVVRSAMMRIARDETKHAALSWSVGQWLARRLDRAAKRKVEQAKRAAVAELCAAAATDAPSFAGVVGLPSARAASRLASEMQRLLWS